MLCTVQVWFTLRFIHRRKLESQVRNGIQYSKLAIFWQCKKGLGPDATVELIKYSAYVYFYDK